MTPSIPAGPERAGSSPVEDDDSLPWGTWLRGAAFVVFLLVMGWLAFNVDLPEPEVIRARIEDAGWAGRLVFVGAYALVAVTPIPVTIVSLVGGVVFGVLEGSILSTIGSMLGALIAYGIARMLGSDIVLRFLGSHARTVQRGMGDGGFDAVFTLRVMPGVPYWPINYGAGALGVALRPFVTASTLATIPGQLALVSIGAMLVEPGWVLGTVVVLTCAAQLAIALRSLRRWRRGVADEGS